MSAKKAFTTTLLFSIIFSFAQTVNIKGKVTDEKNHPLEYATVSVQNPETLSEVAVDYTNAKGEFSIDIDAGNYILYIESFTGAKFEKEVQISKNEDIGVFKIEEEPVVTLKSAELTGSSAPVYRMELDKKVYDVSKDPLSKGRSLSEALENVPSVQVDGEGNVSLRGNDNVRILVDGKQSALISGPDIASALKNLPSDIVDRIEVITNPSARYDAEGSAGIINIVLKKGKLKGFNGSVNVSGGIPTTAGVSANLNYRIGKWNLFTNLGYRYSDSERESESYTTRFNQGIASSYENMNGETTDSRSNYNLMLGTDFYLDDNNIFTLSGTYRKSETSGDSELKYLDFDSDHNQTASSSRTQKQDGNQKSLEGNFNYKRKFNDKGHELTFDAKSSYNDEPRNSSLKEIGNLVNSSERTFDSEKNKNTTLSADYAYPFAEKSKFEFGARADFNNIISNFKVDSLSGEDWIPLNKYTSETDYQQNVFAAYTQFGQAFGKFSYFAGLRVENSNVTVNSVLNHSVVKKNYTDLFPSLFLNYEFESTDQLQLSYSRRIRRPSSWFLIPFSSYSDNRNLFMGNPDLNPQYTDSYELSYITKIGKLTMTPNIYYSRTHDNIQRYQSMTDNGVFVSRPINVGTDDRFGGELTFTLRAFSWWSMMGNVNLFGYKTRGEYTDIFTDISTGQTITQVTNFDGDGFSWFGRLSNTFNLPSKISMQISGMYRAGTRTAQSNRKPMYGVDLSFNKDIFNDNATISFSIRDLFNTRGFRATSYGESFTMDSKFRWGVRSFNVSFSYRFNQSKRDQRKKDQKDNNKDFDMEGPGSI